MDGRGDMHSFFDVGKREIGNVDLKYITSILNRYNDSY